MSGRRPRRVLLAWELGAGEGHARRLAVLGAAFRARGWRVGYAGRSLGAAVDEIRAGADEIFQAPPAQSVPPGGVADKPWRAASFGDLLASIGYEDVGRLEPLVRGWRNLLGAFRPDVLVADFAPTACAVARGRVPTIAIGDGFVVPPVDGERFPRLVGDEPGPRPEEPMRRALGEVLGVPPGDSMPQLPAWVGGDARVVTVLPGFDLYGYIRPGADRAAGPIERLPGRVERPGVGWFFYLAGDYQGTVRVAEGLRASGVIAEGYVRSLRPEVERLLQSDRILLHRSPIEMGAALARRAAVLHHGGIGLVQQAFAAGRPQLTMPRHLEQALNTSRLVSLRVGRGLPTQTEAAAWARALRRFLDDDAMAGRAAEAAIKLDHRGGARVVERVLALATAAVGGDSGPLLRDKFGSG